MKKVVVDNPDKYTAVEDRRRGLCPYCHHEKGDVQLERRGDQWDHKCLKDGCGCNYPVYGKGKRESRR